MAKDNLFEPVQGGVYGKPAEAPLAPQEPVTPPVSAEAVATVEEPITPAEAVETPVVAAPSFDDMLRERSGGKFSKWEDIDGLLNKPAEELKFENEQSKKVFELLKAGKVDEVIDTFNHQRVLNGIGELSDKEAVKLAMKYRDNTLTSDEINDELNDRFALEAPDKPEEDDYLTTEEYQKALKGYEKNQAAYERAQRAAERELKKDAKEARAYLESLKNDIVLPDLPAIPSQVQAQPTIDPVEQERLTKSIQDSFEYALTNLKSHTFKYAEDGVEFETGFDIPQAAMDDMLGRFEKEEFTDVFAKRYIKGDGSLDAMKLMEELHFLENRDSIMKNGIKQALAKAKLDVVKDIKNIDLDQKTRQPITVSDVEKQRQFASSFISA